MLLENLRLKNSLPYPYRIINIIKNLNNVSNDIKRDYFKLVIEKLNDKNDSIKILNEINTVDENLKEQISPFFIDKIVKNKQFENLKNKFPNKMQYWIKIGFENYLKNIIGNLKGSLFKNNFGNNNLAADLHIKKLKSSLQFFQSFCTKNKFFNFVFQINLTIFFNLLHFLKSLDVQIYYNLSSKIYHIQELIISFNLLIIEKVIPEKIENGQKNYLFIENEKSDNSTTSNFLKSLNIISYYGKKISLTKNNLKHILLIIRSSKNTLKVTLKINLDPNYLFKYNLAKENYEEAKDISEYNSNQQKLLIFHLINKLYNYFKIEENNIKKNNIVRNNDIQKIVILILNLSIKNSNKKIGLDNLKEILKKIYTLRSIYKNKLDLKQIEILENGLFKKEPFTLLNYLMKFNIKEKLEGYITKIMDLMNQVNKRTVDVNVNYIDSKCLLDILHELEKDDFKNIKEDILKKIDEIEDIN